MEESGVREWEVSGRPLRRLKILRRTYREGRTAKKCKFDSKYKKRKRVPRDTKEKETEMK